MRKGLAGLIASVCVAATLLMGAGAASATVVPKTYVCTKKANGVVRTAKVYNDTAEDYLSAHGFTCTGD